MHMHLLIIIIIMQVENSCLILPSGRIGDNACTSWWYTYRVYACGQGKTVWYGLAYNIALYIMYSFGTGSVYVHKVITTM